MEVISRQPVCDAGALQVKLFPGWLEDECLPQLAALLLYRVEVVLMEKVGNVHDLRGLCFSIVPLPGPCSNGKASANVSMVASPSVGRHLVTRRCQGASMLAAHLSHVYSEQRNPGSVPIAGQHIWGLSRKLKLSYSLLHQATRPHARRPRRSA